GIEGVEREMADEEVLRERVIIQAPTGAQNGAAIAAQVIGSAQARSKFVEVARIKAGRTAALANQLQRLRCRIEEAEAVAIFIDHAKVVPAQAGVESKFARHAEVILHVKTGVVLVRGTAGVTAELAATVGEVAGKKIFKGKELQPTAIAEIVKL